MYVQQCYILFPGLVWADNAQQVVPTELTIFTSFWGRIGRCKCCSGGLAGLCK
jgi:hypothetical protein